MTLEDLQNLIEIALRGASAVERRWIMAKVAEINGAQAQPPVLPAESPVDTPTPPAVS